MGVWYVHCTEFPPVWHKKNQVQEHLLIYRTFSLTWPASMQFYWNKTKRLHKKSSSHTGVGLAWDTNMAAVSLFWETNMAAVVTWKHSIDLTKAKSEAHVGSVKKCLSTVIQLLPLARRKMNSPLKKWIWACNQLRTTIWSAQNLTPNLYT